MKLSHYCGDVDEKNCPRTCSMPLKVNVSYEQKLVEDMVYIAAASKKMFSDVFNTAAVSKIAR